MHTHLIELVAKVYRVDIVAFQIREHDNLEGTGQQPACLIIFLPLTKKTMQNRRPATIRTEKRNSHPTCQTAGMRIRGNDQQTALLDTDNLPHLHLSCWAIRKSFTKSSLCSRLASKLEEEERVKGKVRE